ncbi:hypothetical protein [Streptomyces boninensis]|uniref:hypothetical protein n=1 Tax=Streptomyces boninensis TaxID=2039455 RepID=UPI003B2153BB
MSDLPPIEIACDESGSDGENLVAGNTDVFTHAGVRLAEADAAAALAEVRARVRSPATQYKANHLLREKHRAVLVWVLSPEGPLAGRGRVHLMEKAYFLVGRLAEALGGDVRVLYGAARAAYEADGWPRFLHAANDLLRTRNRDEAAPEPVAAFYATLDSLGPLDALGGSRPLAEAYRERLRLTPPDPPALDPLFPALARTVAAWGEGGRKVDVVHHTQNALTEERIARLRKDPGVPLGGLQFADPEADPRIQFADFLAGVARKISSDELGGRGDPELTELLRPYLDPASVWGDERSWGALTGAATCSGTGRTP